MKFVYEKWQEDMFRSIYPKDSDANLLKLLTAIIDDAEKEFASLSEHEAENKWKERVFRLLFLNVSQADYNDLQSTIIKDNLQLLITKADAIKLDIQDMEVSAMLLAALLSNWDVVNFLLDKKFDFNKTITSGSYHESMSASEIIQNSGTHDIKEFLTIKAMLEASKIGDIDKVQKSITELQSKKKSMRDARYIGTLSISLLLAAYSKDIYKLDEVLRLMFQEAHIDEMKELDYIFKDVARNQYNTDGYENHLNSFVYVVLKQRGQDFHVISTLTKALIELYNEFKLNGEHRVPDTLLKEIDNLFVHMFSYNFDQPQLADLKVRGSLLDCINKLNLTKELPVFKKFIEEVDFTKNEGADNSNKSILPGFSTSKVNKENNTASDYVAPAKNNDKKGKPGLN